MTLTHAETRNHAVLPGAEVVAGIRSLLIWAIVAVGMLATLISGGMSSCSGGIDGGGRFLDADGRVTDVAPMCGSVTVSASPLVYVAIALVVLWSLTRVQHRATTVEHALRMVNNARLVILVLTLTTFVVAYWAISTVHVDDWSSYSLLAPFPFASFDVSTHPMGANG